MTIRPKQIGDRLSKLRAGFAFALFALLFASQAWSAPIVIIYPGSDGLAIDKLNNYYIALLDLALSKTGIDYQLENYKHKMVRARLWEQLEANDGVSVDWGTITPEIVVRGKSVTSARVNVSLHIF